MNSKDCMGVYNVVSVVAATVVCCGASNAQQMDLSFARQELRGRWIVKDFKLDDEIRQSIHVIASSQDPVDIAFLPKCLRFCERPTAMMSETAGYFYPARSYSLGYIHAASFVNEFGTSSSLSDKLFIASEIELQKIDVGTKGSLRDTYTLIQQNSRLEDFGPSKNLDDLLYVIAHFNTKLNWKVIRSPKALEYPLDANSRSVLHECFPDWAWLKANVPKPSQEEVLAFLKESNPDAYATRMAGSSAKATTLPVGQKEAIDEPARSRYFWWVSGVSLVFFLSVGYLRGKKCDLR